MRTPRTLSLSLALLVAPLAACPPSGSSNDDASASGARVALTVAGIDFPIELPADPALGAWGLVDGNGKEGGAVARTTPQGAHATAITFIEGASSCDVAFATARKRAEEQGRPLAAQDRPAWLPSRYWPIGLEGADDASAVWIACLDTKRGPLGATTVVTPKDGDAKALAPHAKTALDAIADAALAAATKAGDAPLPPG